MFFRRSLLRLTPEPITDPRRYAREAPMPTKLAIFKYSNWYLPISLVFAICCIVVSLRFDAQRRGEGPCVDCARQREIADEIYFGKKPPPQVGHRM